MVKYLKKLLMFVLVIVLIAGMFPLSISAAPHDTLTLKNEAVEVNVSKQNGGFSIKTTDGDKLNKDDINKDLLFHNGEYDTSFTSFEVTYPGNTVRNYIFGASYGFLGLASSNVDIREKQGVIIAVWSVDGIEFTQRIELANVGSLQHGMVNISYSVRNNSSSNVSIKARILLDSALGSQDYAYYEVMNTSNNAYRSVATEQIIKDYIPQNFFGYNDTNMPSITSYTVNDAAFMPYQIAFGHWNNLAMTAFDFTPISSLNFTNQGNKEYLTADSAYALYYNLGNIAKGSENNKLHTYYGVYSNEGVRPKESMAINTTAPTALELNADKKQYMSPDTGIGDGRFTVQTSVMNFVQTGARDYKKVAVAIYPSTGIEALDSFGNPLGYAVNRTDPYIIYYSDFKVAQIQSTNLYFKAHIQQNATYGKIEIRIFDMPDDANDVLLQENLLGQSSLFILMPGNDGNIPKISFANVEQPTLYYMGNRHMYLTGSNVDSLLAGSVESGNCTVYAYDITKASNRIDIPKEYIRFPGENAVDILFTKAMAEGTYQVVFDWQQGTGIDGVDDPLTSRNLRVTMSSDPKFKNEGYGVLTVVQTVAGGPGGSAARYQVIPFIDEKAYTEALAKKYYTVNGSTGKYDFDEVLLTLRGQFTVEKEDSTGNPIEWKAVSLGPSESGGDANLNNIITLNNCIDFEDGTIRVYYKGSSEANREILVDFDGDLYTSVSRTSIWTGVAAITSIKNGKEYYLMAYDKNGTRLSTTQNAESITLIWPGAASLAQKVGGMLFNMVYAQLGVMYNGSGDPNVLAHQKESMQGYLTSFGAKLDLGFLIPSNKKKDALEPSAWKRLKEMAGVYDHDTDILRQQQSMRPYDPAIDEPNPKETKGAAAVMVEDILFGLGKGFVGFKCDVNLTIPGYIDAMPNISGKLKINTIGDWSVALSGKCKFTTISFEADVAIRSYKGIPIPDKLYLYIEGFSPGINLDGFGVLWLTGAGGGIDNLYDTIFLTSSVPPLKLLLSAQFKLLSILSARVDMGLSLRGISLKMSNVTISDTSIVVIPGAQASFEWYPNVKMTAAVGVQIYAIINGSGYIVCDTAKDNYEFFVRARISIPESIPFVGGLSAGGVDLGVNQEKIWGVLEIIKIKMGITYFWGGDVSFGTGSKDFTPTYPELLYVNSNGSFDAAETLRLGGCVPVYYDEELKDTLYMTMGNNIKLNSEAVVVPGISKSPDLKLSWKNLSKTALTSITPATETQPLISNEQKNEHSLYLASTLYSGNDAMLTLQYPADNKNQAKSIATDVIKIKDELNNPYELILYDENKSDNSSANAYVQYDATKKMATLTLTMTEDNCLDKPWFITTPYNTNVALYEVESLPALSTITGTRNDSKIDVTYSGTNLDQADEINFYLTQNASVSEDSVADMGTWIGAIDNLSATGGTASFAIPASLPSGDYKLRAICTKEGSVNQSLIASGTIYYTNTHQPAVPSGLTVTQQGDLMLKVTVGNISNNPTGYILNVYKLVGGQYELTDLGGITFEKTEDDQGTLVWPDFLVGGTYDFENDQGVSTKVGLLPGETYKVGVTAVNYELNADGSVQYMVSSKEILSDAVTIQASTSPDIVCTTTAPFKTLNRLEWGTDTDGNATQNQVEHDTFKQTDINFTFTATETVTGTFQINGEDFAVGGNTVVSGTSFDIRLTNLKQGDHQLVFSGTNAKGDSFRMLRSFTVDTAAPNLQLSVPTNNGYFGQDNILTIAGSGDADALYTVLADGEAKATKKTIAQLGGTFENGLFSFNIDLGIGNASRRVLIIAEDEMGNTATNEVTVSNNGLGDIRSLSILYSRNTSFIGDMEWQPLEGNNIPFELARNRIVLGIEVETNAGNKFILPSDNSQLEWNLQMVQGSAELDENGILTATQDTKGMIAANYAVADNAAYSAAATLGAKATVNYGEMPEIDKHTLTYDANGGKGSLIDPVSPYMSYTEVTVLKNAFTYSERIFTGWNTKKDGKGASYKPGDKFIITNDTVLYAQWKKNSNGVNTGDTFPWIYVVLLIVSSSALIFLLWKKRRKKRARLKE